MRLSPMSSKFVVEDLIKTRVVIYDMEEDKKHKCFVGAISKTRVQWFADEETFDVVFNLIFVNLLFLYSWLKMHLYLLTDFVATWSSLRTSQHFDLRKCFVQWVVAQRLLFSLSC